MRSTHSRGLSPKLQVYLVMGTAGKSLQQLRNTMRGITQWTASLALACAAPAHTPGLNAETRQKGRILFKHNRSWQHHRNYQARQGEAKLIKLKHCTHCPASPLSLPTPLPAASTLDLVLLTRIFQV